jgi:phospholipase/carboxylesterase
VDTLAMRIAHRDPEPGEGPPPTGFVWVERDPARAFLLTPDEIDFERRYPLVVVLHGAGRQDEILAKALRDEPERRQALFLIPRSVLPTWDLIASDGRPDLDFLEHALDLVWRRYPVDPRRVALLGYSDGASYGLSVGLSNPRVFSAVMGWAAGFKIIDRSAIGPDDEKPRVLLEYGSHDPLFPFEQVAVPMRDDLRARGYDLEFRVDEGGRHWPSGDFQREALDWFFGG